LKCKEGSIKDSLVSANVFVEHGNFKYARCITRDITTLRKTEKLLRLLNTASEELGTSLDTQEALDKILKFIVPQYADWFTIDTIKNGERSVVRMAHADPEKIIWAQKYRAINPVDLNDERPGSLGWVIRTGQPVLVGNITDEMILSSANDEEHFQVIKAIGIKSLMIIPMVAHGKTIGVVCFISCNIFNRYDEQDFGFAKDLTNRITLTLENARLYEEVKKDAQQRFEESKRKDEFISVASHELKTPVTSLKAYTQSLQGIFQKQNNEQAAGMLAKMDKQVNKLTKLIIDLLDVSKITGGKMAFDFESFDFNELVTETAEELQRTTSTHHITLRLSNCTVRGDRNRLSQVLTNLISNAIKYSPGANEIIVSSAFDDTKLKLCVQDFGIGLSEDERDKVFTRFYRAHGVNNFHFPGLGLGLFISSEIIKRHAGTITFKSTKGQGSKFCFTLPL
jgi:signal transduction histidine kinase